MPTVPKEPLKGNIGEWSELYALGYLLIHAGAYAADENQNAIPEVFHKVLQVFISEKNGMPETQYKIGASQIAVLISGSEIATIDRSLLEASVKYMLSEIKDGNHKRTFELISGNSLVKLIHRSRISASSTEHENDLDLVMEDPATGAQTPRVGFNIKSQIGGRATLLNASGATNFIYKIVPTDSSQNRQYPNFEHGKHRQNLKKLYEAGYRLEFEKTSSDIFHRNLILLDMQFPHYLAKALLHSYLSGEDSYLRAVDSVFDPEDVNSRQPKFKLKEFLGAVAMGLRPSIEWDGDTTKFSGILVVKNNGEVVFYYLYNRKNFEEYLFKNVSFERPSTSRHKYGYIYNENGVDKIKLNLQIRFKS
jgi:hypothetical protein